MISKANLGIYSIPIMDRLVYPFLTKLGIAFKPITRITFGFVFGSLAMAYPATVQHLIYLSGPCYDAPAACPAARLPDGTSAPNNIHVAIQTPAYAPIGLSEIFAAVTGTEYAFTKAPASMKAFVMSIYLLTNALGSALAIALTPTAVNPKLLWMYAGLACSCLVAGGIFWALYSRFNVTEESMNEIDRDREKIEVPKNREGSSESDGKV